MILEPHEEQPLDGPQRSVTIKARRFANGTWEVYCPEWRCTLHNTNLTKCVAMLCANIEAHNEACGSAQGNKPSKPLGKTQAAFLKALREHGSYCEQSGWVWGSVSRSIRLAEGLVRRGLATKSEETHTPLFGKPYMRVIYKPV